MSEQQGFFSRTDGRIDDSDRQADTASDATLQAALASLSPPGTGSRPPRPSDVKWRLTTLIFPAILLLFVALYVTSLTAGVEPEVALFRSGGVSLVLAVLGRAAVSILGDESRLVLNDSQIVALAQNGAVRDYFASSAAGPDSDHDNQPSTTAETAGAGGKE